MTGLLRISANRYISSFRTFTRNAIRFDKSNTSPAAVDAEVQSSGKLSGRIHRVNKLEKRILVWTGKYKSIADVPALVSPEQVEKARNKARIRLANIMIAITALACLGMVISGKRAAARGETVQKANLDWHKRVEEEAMAKK